jgi:tRNA threonylcarbamoyladenosine biosynthesis protein TsaE
LILVTSSPEETLVLGERIAGNLAPGAVIALRGGLGAGKTCLAAGIARGLGICEQVTSPTYTIANTYCGHLPFCHIDAYRLAGDDDFKNSGIDELLREDGIAVIEWSERVPFSIPPNAVIITIEITGPTERAFRVSGMELADEWQG